MRALLILILFPISILYAAPTQEQFKSFLEESAKARHAQAEEIYKLKLSLLNKQHEEQKKLIDEINELSLQMKFGDKEHNKKIKKQIKEKWRAMKEDREEQREQVKELRKKFKEENKKRRREFKKSFDD